MSSRRRTVWKCWWTSLLACAWLLASSVEKAATVECYCNSGGNCVNNSCSQEGGRCIVELKTLEDGGHHLDYYCFGALLACISENPHRCCPFHSCNRCLLPNFNQANPRPEGVDLNSLLPPGCVENVTTQQSPPLTTSSGDPSHSPPPSSSAGGDSTQQSQTTSTTAQPGATDQSGVKLNLPAWLYAIISLSILLVVLSILTGVLISCLFLRRRQHCEVDSIGNPSISEMLTDEPSQSNGSGGLKHCRFLEPRTIGQQVAFKERLAKGGFGEVWRGDLNGEPVAVKVISSLLEDCWKKEQEIYLTNMLHHESILRFIAVDSKLIEYSQKLIIIVEYHPHGSLFDYLSSHVITTAELLKLMTSVINGVAFLHMPVKTSFTEREKPAIAHRDLKTRNILVKQDGNCCIADFGLSVRSDKFVGEQKPPDPIKGTKRYMAPEILAKTINGRDFQSFVRVDIYSFGLVLWETARRCGDIGEVGEYQVAYQNCVPNDPSIEDMKKVVVTEGIRPDIDKRWHSCEVMSTVASIMQECWRANPRSRLSAFRIKKKLLALTSDVKEIVPPHTNLKS